MSNKIDNDFARYWKNLDFQGWNEMDVREDFIAPLLRILGYAKNTVNSVLREESLALSEKFHRIGRKRVDVDYIPTLRLKRFWIIEAKPPFPEKMDFGDLLQAHFYSIHPEVQAKYVVITNGREIRIYDAVRLETWDDALFVSNQSDCETTFPKIREFLSARTMLASIRQHNVEVIRDSLSVEVDEKALDELQRNISKVILESRSIIQNNARNIQRQAFLETEEKERQALLACDFQTLLVRMDIPTHCVPIYGREIFRRFTNANENERASMIDKLAMEYRGRPHSIFRVHCADAFARMVGAKYDLPKSNYITSLKNCLEELVEGSLTYWGNNPLSNALVHLDNTSLRLARKVCIRFMMKPLTGLVEMQKEAMSAEDFLRERPSVSGHMVANFGLLAEKIWRQHSSKSSADEIWKAIWLLEEVEKIIDAIDEPKYPTGEGDLLWFQNYGRGFDMLLMGTWDVVNGSKANLFSLNLPKSTKQILSMTRENALKSLPSSRPAPPDMQINDLSNKSREEVAEMVKIIVSQWISNNGG